MRLGDIGRGGGGMEGGGLEGFSNGAQSRFGCGSMIFRCIWAAGSSAGPVGGSIEYGFIRGESATVRMPSIPLAALPKDSPDATSGEVVRAKEGERGRVEPEPETEKRLLRERTPFGGRGDDGRDGRVRRLGGRGVVVTSSLNPFCSGLLVSSGELKEDLTGECSIPCIRMESITSKSPRGSGTLDELDGIPRPARTDLKDRIMRKRARVNKGPSECAPLAKDSILNRVDPVL